VLRAIKTGMTMGLLHIRRGKRGRHDDCNVYVLLIPGTPLPPEAPTGLRLYLVSNRTPPESCPASQQDSGRVADRTPAESATGLQQSPIPEGVPEDYPEGIDADASRTPTGVHDSEREEGKEEEARSLPREDCDHGQPRDLSPPAELGDSPQSEQGAWNLGQPLNLISPTIESAGEPNGRGYSAPSLVPSGEGDVPPDDDFAWPPGAFDSEGHDAPSVGNGYGQPSDIMLPGPFGDALRRLQVARQIAAALPGPMSSPGLTATSSA
jgi:hypothetical protein